MIFHPEKITAFKMSLMYALLANLLFHLVNAIVYYFQEYKNTLIEVEELEQDAAHAGLQLLRSRINPHFRFNNLNVLSALVMKGNTAVNLIIEAFSKAYRNILTNHNKVMVTLKTAGNHIKPYIFLSKKMVGEGLQVALHFPSYCEEHFIIPASIQMLIENALKHNMVSRNKPFHIAIHESGNGTMVVSNNLPLKSPTEKSTVSGLRNIIK